ncbi:VCBS repeat-containing protein [Nocardiopsis sp. CT-R113]|uniref:VCBS repeat-containing protein n=1 Tax=Nocardiopsis codii TaxID=3065942 RepID=A0ABU7KF46_9ACTN|nr:VCBS repeat-containing protein [Nocardiopsis sp. CT-R113]MEE2040855.1 VCBS repeat-containing protein [Nocardiopsis sp. CT-R113]
MGRLIADVDNDGHLDRITGTKSIGTDLAIAFGEESGFAEPRTTGLLLGSSREEGEEVMAAVADFDGDGWLDLAIAATGPVAGDDPVPSRVAELRLGPFSDRGTGQRTDELDLGTTFGLRVVDFDDDEHPDLASYYYDGDGVYGMGALLGGVEGGLSDQDERFSDFDFPGYNLPRAGPEGHLPPSASDRFHPACDA